MKLRNTWFLAPLWLVLGGCSSIQRDTPLQVWDDMKHQQKFKAQAPVDGIFADGRSNRLAPEDTVARESEARWIRAEIARLPGEFREVIVLRELEELSYREISEVVRVPMGTVMSRLARARAMLAERVRTRAQKEQA